MNSPAAPAAPKAAKKSHRIMIADTNKSRFADLIKGLEEVGADVEHVPDRNLVLNAAVNHKPEVLLINLFLNSSSTISLIRDLREHFGEELRIIVITSHYSKTNIQECVKAGANDFILEPFDFKLMVQRIRYQLQERSAFKPEELKVVESTQLLEGFQLVYDCLRIVGEVKDAHPAIHECLKKISDLAKSTRVNVVLGDVETGAANILASSDDANLENLQVDLERYPEVREVLLNGNIIYIKDVTANPLTKDIKAQVKSIDITSLIVIPVRHRQETIGTLNIRMGKGGMEMTDKHLKSFYMAALALSSKVAAKKMLKKLGKGAS